MSTRSSELCRVGSFAVNQVLSLFYITLWLQELWLEMQETLLTCLSSSCTQEAHLSALPYLPSSKTVRENQEDSGPFLPHECLLQALDIFIEEQGPQVLGSLLAVPLMTFSTLWAFYKSTTFPSNKDKTIEL